MSIPDLKIRKAILNQKGELDAKPYMSAIKIERLFGKDVITRQTVNNWVRRGYISFLRRDDKVTRYIDMNSFFKYIEEKTGGIL